MASEGNLPLNVKLINQCRCGLRGWHALYAGRRFCDLNCCQCRLCRTGVHSAVWKPFSLEHALKNIAVQLFHFDKWNNLLEVPFGPLEVTLQRFSMLISHIKHGKEINYDGTFWNLNSPHQCACSWILEEDGIPGGKPTWKVHSERPTLESNHLTWIWFANATPLYQIQYISHALYASMYIYAYIQT